MNFTSLTRFAPITSTEALVAPGSLRAGRLIVDRGAFRLLRPDLPILVDHDDDRQVGVVREVFVHDDTDGEWHAVLARFTDPPGWLQRGTRVSFAYNPLRRQQIWEWTRVNSGLLTEISVLSSSLKPADPSARVMTFGPERPNAGEEIIYSPPGTIIRRQCGRVLAVR